MLKFLGQMLKLPVAAFVASVEILARAMRDFQKSVDQTIETATSAADSLKQFDRERTPEMLDCTDVEDVHMPDQDLSSDDLKYVSYSIVFTKRDYEATLESYRHQVVNYSTNGGSYGGIKIAHFMSSVARGEVERPQTWKENNYPKDAIDDRHWTIPEEDERYITFIYEVEQRLPKETSDYDRRKTRALEEISNKL
jgi:hypothetical protein